MKLRTTQQYFAHALSTQDEQSEKLFKDSLCSNPHISEQHALDIYRNNTRGARIKALQSVYPVLEQVIGKQCFYQIAHDYVHTHPSKLPDLNKYGDSFPDFIKAHTINNSVFSDLLYLHDLARLEWGLNIAYFADNDVNSMASLLDRDANNITLKTSKTLSLVQSVYPVHAIWQKHKTGNNVTEITALTEADHLVIYRNVFRPEIVQVDIEDWQLLTEIKETTNMHALAEFSLKMNLSLETHLPALIQRGWVIVV